MLIEDAVLFIQHYNMIMYKMKVAVNRQRLAFYSSSGTGF